MNKRTFLKSLSVLAAGASLATSQPLIGASHTATPTLVKPKPLKKGNHWSVQPISGNR